MTDDPSSEWFVGMLVCIAVVTAVAVADLMMTHTWEVALFVVALVAVAAVPYAVGWVTVRVFGIEVES